MSDRPDERPSVRRRDERCPTRVTVLVHCHGRFQTALIVDFSLGGLQLQGCFGVGVADNVAVELLSGHRFPAKVAWSIGGRAGVRFLQPLSAEDPAMEALREAARRGLDRAAGERAARHQSATE